MDFADFFKNFVNTCNSTFFPISDTFPTCFGEFLTVNATVESLINYFFVIFKVSRPRLAKIGLETPSLHTVLPVVDLGPEARLKRGPNHDRTF